MATSRYNRLALDENNPKQAGKDVDTGKTPVFTLAAPYVLKVARVVDEVVSSIADWTAVRLQITSQCRQDGDRYLDLTQSTLNQSLTQTQWDAGTSQHATFTFTAQDMNLALDSCDNGPLYFVVTATRSDNQIVPVGYGTINVDRAHQTGSNLVLSKLTDNFPQLALTAAVSEGPLSVAVLPGLDGAPNHFHFAFRFPVVAADVIVSGNSLVGLSGDTIVSLQGEALLFV